MTTRDILSDDELDALLDGVVNGDIAAPGSTVDPGEVREFDFNAREHSMLGQLPALQIINDKLAFGFTRGLNALFNIPVEVNLLATSVCKLDDILKSLPLPAGVNSLRLKPLHGVALLTVPPVLLFFLVDQYFGNKSAGNSGAESIGVDEKRSVTPTERRINELLVRRFLEVLQQSWAEFLPLNCEHAGFESNPDFIQIADPAELVVKTTLELKFANWSEEICLAIPYAALEPVRAKLGSTITASGPGADKNWSAAMQRELLAVPLDLSGVYVSCQLSLRKLMALEVGDIIPVEGDVPAELLVEGMPLFSGEYGTFQGKKSIKIFGRYVEKD